MARAQPDPLTAPAVPAATVATTSPAAPAPGRVQLVYTIVAGAHGCDSEQMWRKLVSGVTSAASVTGEPGKPGDEPRDPFALTGSPTHVYHVRFSLDSPGIRAVAELREVSGALVFRRGIVDRDCHTVADMLAMSTALWVFPPPAPDPEPPPARDNLDLDKETRRRLDALQARAEAHADLVDSLNKKIAELGKNKKGPMDLSFALSAGALITANLTSDPGPGIWIGGDARSGPFVLGLELRGVLPAPVRVGPFDFDLSQVAALLTPCGRYSYFFGCGVAGLGVQFHHDSNLGESAQSGQHPLVQLGARLGAEVPFGDSIFGARAWGEALFSTPSTFVTYDLVLRVDRPSVSAFFGLGLFVKLGEEGEK